MLGVFRERVLVKLFYMPELAYGKMRQEKNVDFCRMGEGARVDSPISKNVKKQLKRGGMYALKQKNTCKNPQVFAFLFMGIPPYVKIWASPKIPYPNPLPSGYNHSFSRRGIFRSSSCQSTPYPLNRIRLPFSRPFPCT